MGLVQDIREEVLLECDPGRPLHHASYYLWKHAGCFPLTPWVDAQEILRHARNECENQNRIEFVRASNTPPGTRLSLPKLLISAAELQCSVLRSKCELRVSCRSILAP